MIFCSTGRVALNSGVLKGDQSCQFESNTWAGHGTRDIYTNKAYVCLSATQIRQRETQDILYMILFL